PRPDLAATAAPTPVPPGVPEGPRNDLQAPAPRRLTGTSTTGTRTRTHARDRRPGSQPRGRVRPPLLRAPDWARLQRALAGVWHPRSAEARRRRVVLGSAAAFSGLILLVGFPFSTLLSQHRQLSAAAAQLQGVRHQNHELRIQERQLSSKAEIERRARQDYQLVEPGQTLFVLLSGPGASPSSSAGKGSRTAAAATGVNGGSTADPANQPLVSPSRAADLAPDPGLPAPAPAPVSRSSGGGRTGGSRSGDAGSSSGSGGAGASRAGGPGAPTSFWSRVADTLEFWN
ncbi:MAG TPA: septum formation initiator family protein, partial [Acidimicrobiales bacterium]|nr:septum formation initiator family protein [Acidimicrobiales bacterium]